MNTISIDFSNYCLSFQMAKTNDLALLRTRNKNLNHYLPKTMNNNSRKQRSEKRRTKHIAGSCTQFSVLHPTVDKKQVVIFWWFFHPIFRGLGFASPMFFINFWPTIFFIYFSLFFRRTYMLNVGLLHYLLCIGFFRLVFLEPFSKGILCTRFGIHVSWDAKWTQNSHTFRLSYVNG